MEAISPHTISYMLIVIIFYKLLKYIYRLTFHPLARFPGPRFAAASRLYAFSIDAGSSSVVKYLPEWHRKYGPIVRVRPNELHIADWNAYCQVFNARSRFDKDMTFYTNPIADGSFFNVSSAKVAKPHKDLYQSHFSKAAVARLEPLIHEKLSLFLARLSGAASEHQTINLGSGYSCLTADTVMHWTYRKSFGILDDLDLNPQIIQDFNEMLPITPLLWYFPGFFGIIFRIVRTLPEHVRQKYFPAVAGLDWIFTTCKTRVNELAKQPPRSKEVAESIFATALNPDIGKGHMKLALSQLYGDAVVMFLAGTDTTSNTLVVGTWNLLQNAHVLRNLLAELDEAMPDRDRLYSQAHLERLPYLRAVIKESLRIACGPSARLTRLTPSEGTHFCGQYIPPGTPVSFSNFVYNFDEQVFGDPHTFRPERWLVPDVSELEARMVSFSRGRTSCIGINVAYAELYNTFAHTFRRFSLTIDGTTEADMEWKDCFVPRRNGCFNVKLDVRP